MGRIDRLASITCVCVCVLHAILTQIRPFRHKSDAAPSVWRGLILLPRAAIKCEEELGYPLMKNKSDLARPIARPRRSQRSNPYDPFVISLNGVLEKSA